MKKFTILFFIIAFSCLKISAQYRDYFSNIGQLGGRVTKTGYGIQADMMTTTKSGFINRYSLSYDMGEIGIAKTNYQTIKAEFIMMSIMASREQRYFNLGWGGFVSHETVRNNLLDMSENRISPGICAMLEFEIFFKYWGFYIVGEQRYRPISLIGDLEWRAGLGVKYLFK